MNKIKLDNDELNNQTENNLDKENTNGENSKYTKIPLKKWIVGLCGPIFIFSICGLLLLALIIIKNYGNQNFNAYLPSINITRNKNQQVQSNNSNTKVDILDTKTALEKIHSMDVRIFSLKENAKEKYSDAELNTIGKTLNYNVTLDYSIPAYFGVGLCARNEIILKNKLSDMEIMLMVDGVDVDQDHVAVWNFYHEDGQVCQRFDVVLDNWSVGEHYLIDSIKINKNINDGITEFGPGELSSIIKVIVNSKEKPTLSTGN